VPTVLVFGSVCLRVDQEAERDDLVGGTVRLKPDTTKRGSAAAGHTQARLEPDVTMLSGWSGRPLPSDQMPDS
jgi:hypothetical protein